MQVPSAAPRGKACVAAGDVYALAVATYAAAADWAAAAALLDDAAARGVAVHQHVDSATLDAVCAATGCAARPPPHAAARPGTAAGVAEVSEDEDIAEEMTFGL